MVSLKKELTENTAYHSRLTALVKSQLLLGESIMIHFLQGKWLWSKEAWFLFFSLFFLTFYKYVLSDEFFNVCALLPEFSGRGCFWQRVQRLLLLHDALCPAVPLQEINYSSLDAMAFFNLWSWAHTILEVISAAEARTPFSPPLLCDSS